MTTACDLEITVAPLSAVPAGEGRNFEVAGERIAVFHTRAGQVYAIQADCPHKKGPLADGLVGASTVICPLHSIKFNLKTGEPWLGECTKLKTYAVRVDDQQRIVLTVAVGEGSDLVM